MSKKTDKAAETKEPKLEMEGVREKDLASIMDAYMAFFLHMKKVLDPYSDEELALIQRQTIPSKQAYAVLKQMIRGRASCTLLVRKTQARAAS
jgi:hypothetical protein